MSFSDPIGERMKRNYEKISSYCLTRRTPVIVRIDGNAFHTFTRGFNRPYDNFLQECMAKTINYLCQHVHGCVFGYQQSDEISLCLIDYKKINSQPYFDYKVQKISSITASMATMIFNLEFSNAPDSEIYQRVKGKAIFDSRCFNIPKEEVTNYFYWRQLDATRNSINLVGQHYFSHRELQNKNCNDVQDMLFTQHKINWNNYPTSFKRGIACYKSLDGWIIDYEIPIFKNENRTYIEKHLQPEE